MNVWSGRAERLKPNDVSEAAAALGVPLAALMAVLAVEARGSGFDGQGRPIILFEPHILARQLAARDQDNLLIAIAAGVAYRRWGARPYPKGQQAQYNRLDRACLIDPEAAFRSVSVGLGQVLGVNYAGCGYVSAREMFAGFQESEASQLEGMLRLIRGWGLVPAMCNQDWPRFARKYNGAGAVPKYSRLLAAAYRQALAATHSAPIARPAAPRLIFPPVVVTTYAPPAAVIVPRATTKRRRTSTTDLNNTEFARVRRPAAMTSDDLNARELERIRRNDP